MRKLLLFTIGFAIAAATGIYLIAADHFLIYAAICAVLLAACLLMYLRISQMRIVAVILLGAFAGFLWQFGYDRLYLSVPNAADEMLGTLCITATDYSEETEYGGVVEGNIQLNGKPYRIRTYLPKDVAISPGDQITGPFLLRSTMPECSRDSSYYRSSGIFLIAYPRGDISISFAEKLPWYGYPAATRQYLQQTMDAAFPEKAAAFARALLLGDSDQLDYKTDTDFKVSGVRHIIAVSGLHISILYSLLFLLTGKRKLLTSIISIFILLFFAAIAGFTPSITRACIMHGLMSLAFIFKKEYDAPTALSFAVLIMLILDPWIMGNVGFQLSVGCVMGILLFSESIQNWLLDKTRLGKYVGWRGKIAHWFALSVSVSISATVITTPLCALYFGMVSLVSIITNLLTLWVITYIFYGIVFVCLLSLIAMPLAAALAWVVTVPIFFVIWLTGFLASFPLAAVYMKSDFTVFWLVFCYLALAAFLLMKRKRPILLGCCCLIVLCLAVFVSWTEPLLDECRVTVLDVGQGQCILLQSEGKNYLVDCGGDSDTMAADAAANLLLSQGIFYLDGLILTHFDADHAAGAVLLLSRVAVDHIFIPNSLDTDGTRNALMDAADCPVSVLEQDLLLTFGDASITLIPSKSAETDNESGLCVLFQTVNYDILITGDRSISGEEELLRHMQLPQLELLIVGHHGSKYSTGPALLHETMPKMAIISVSADNTYGHPASEVLERLEKYGCVIYRTDRDGTVIFRG